MKIGGVFHQKEGNQKIGTDNRWLLKVKICITKHINLSLYVIVIYLLK